MHVVAKLEQRGKIPNKNLSLSSWLNLAGSCGTCMLVLLIGYLIAENGFRILYWKPFPTSNVHSFAFMWDLVLPLLLTGCWWISYFSKQRHCSTGAQQDWMQSIVTQWEWRNISYHLSAILTSVNSWGHMCNSNHLCKKSLCYSPVT